MIRMLSVACAVIMSANLVLADDVSNVQKIFRGEVAPASLADLKAMETAQRKLSQRCIEVTVGLQIGPAQGSGVIINKEGMVLTAAHVIGKPGQSVRVMLPNGKVVRGETLGLNRDIDAGMMKIIDKREGGWPHVEMGDFDKVRPGQWVIATGHPGGYMRGRKPVVRLGRVLFKRDDVVTSDCPLIGGDSGGPLFDMQGKVIGINSRIGGALTANMHVPVSTYQEDWDRMAASEMWGAVPRGSPYIGVSGGSEKQKAVEGALIEWVKPGGPGDKSGLKIGDVVKSFDGKKLADFKQLVLEVSNKKPGDKIPLRVKRGEETIDLVLSIGVAGRR